MRKTITVLLTMGMATSALAKGENQDIMVVTYPDFVAVDLVSETHNVNFSVAGPDGYRANQVYAAKGTEFFDTQNAEGVTLADGLYKWEAWTSPRELISREDSSAMPNRNEMSLKNQFDASRTSGSFRVVNGAIVNPELQEGAERSMPNQGAVK